MSLRRRSLESVTKADNSEVIPGAFLEPDVPITPSTGFLGPGLPYAGLPSARRSRITRPTDQYWEVARLTDPSTLFSSRH